MFADPQKNKNAEEVEKKRIKKRKKRSGQEFLLHGKQDNNNGDKDEVLMKQKFCKENKTKTNLFSNIM